MKKKVGSCKSMKKYPGGGQIDPSAPKKQIPGFPKPSMMKKGGSVKKYVAGGLTNPGDGRDSIPSSKSKMIIRPGYRFDPKVKGTRVIESNQEASPNYISPGWPKPKPIRKEKIGGSVSKMKKGGTIKSSKKK